MTKKRTSKPNTSIVDHNEKIEELILADLDLMREDWELAPVSLADVMDDHHIVDNDDVVVMPIDYDPLISDSNAFDNHLKKLNAAAVSDSHEAQTLSNTDVLDKIHLNKDLNAVDQTIVVPIDIDLTTEIFTHSIIENHETPIDDPSPIVLEKPLTDDLADLINFDISKESTLKNELPNIPSNAVITDYESKLNRISLISYAALGLSLSALVAMAYLSTLVINTKTSNAKLTDLVSSLQVEIKDLTSKYEDLQSSNKDVVIDSNIPQQLENVIAVIKSVSVPTKNKIIHTVVKSTPLKKVDIQASQLKHTSIPLVTNKKYKPH